ncbi:MAG: hypothetical protein OXL36_12980 [Bryobacterales bacterium]|nr:hypothetical protein [Bryobacterales bacterium]MDE0294205.1 hypothetical protein [Bryobacterales bacterium]
MTIISRSEEAADEFTRKAQARSPDTLAVEFPATRRVEQID